jgi:hypothetical protein
MMIIGSSPMFALFLPPVAVAGDEPTLEPPRVNPRSPGTQVLERETRNKLIMQIAKRGLQNRCAGENAWSTTKNQSLRTHVE